MSLIQGYKNLVAANRACATLFDSLAASKKQRSVLADTITSAADSVQQFLAGAPKQSLIGQDLMDAREKLLAFVKEAKRIAKDVSPSAATPISLPKFNARISALRTAQQGIEFILDNAKAAIDKAGANMVNDGKSTRKPITTDEFIEGWIDAASDDPSPQDPQTPRSDSVQIALVESWLNGLTHAEQLAVATKRGPMLRVLTALGTKASRAIAQIATSEMHSRQQDNAARRELEENLRTDRGITNLTQLRARFEPKLQAAKPREGGIAIAEVPILATFGADFKLETFKSVGIEAEKFTLEKFSNGKFILAKQSLLVFRMSDAKDFARQEINESRKGNAEIQQLKNLNAAARRADKAVADIEARLEKLSEVKQPRAYAKVKAELTEAKKEQSAVQLSLKATADSAEAQKKLLRLKDKRNKADSSDMVQSYVTHLLEIINARTPTEYALMSAKALTKMVNVDFVHVWIAPRFAVKRLIALSSSHKRLITDWSLPWA